MLAKQSFGKERLRSLPQIFAPKKNLTEGLRIRARRRTNRRMIWRWRNLWICLSLYIISVFSFYLYPIFFHAFEEASSHNTSEIRESLLFSGFSNSPLLLVVVLCLHWTRIFSEILDVVVLIPGMHLNFSGVEVIQIYIFISIIVAEVYIPVFIEKFLYENSMNLSI